MRHSAKDSNTVAAAWKLYDAERMENERLRQQLAEKSAEASRRLDLVNTLDADNESLRQQLAAIQLREQLRAHLEVIAGKRMCVDNTLGNVDIAELALALPQDSTALEAMITKAGEVMRERCANYLVSGRYMVLNPLQTLTAEQHSKAVRAHDTHQSKAIRALPGVTLEDLK